MLRSYIKNNYYFTLILISGIFLRSLALLFVPIVNDTVSYTESARFIIELNYESLRPPGFPLLIVPLLIITGNGALSAKIISFISSILLIFSSYFVFTKASLIFFENSENSEKKAKKTGLLTSFLISFNIFFIIHSGKGLREDLIALLLLWLFYYIIIKEELSLKDNICLAFVISFLTLTQLSTGFITIVGLILFFIISQFKWFKFKPIPNKRFLLTVISFIFSFFLWSIFSAFKWGDLLANWNTQGAWFGVKYGISLTSFDNIIKALLHALSFGLPSIFIYLFVLFGFFLIITMLFILIRKIRIKQFFFIFMIIGLNYAYLTIYVTTPRVIMYFFPIILYIAAIPMGVVFVDLERKEKKFQKKINYVFIIFLVSYILRGLDTISIIYLIYQIYNYIPHFGNINTIISIFLQSFNPITIIINLVIIIINEITFLFYIIKNKDSLYFKIKNELNKS